MLNSGLEHFPYPTSCTNDVTVFSYSRQSAEASVLLQRCPTVAMVPLSPALLLCIPALCVTVKSFSFISGLKTYNRHENPQLPNMCTLVFGLSHRGFALICPYPYPPCKLGTMPSDCPFSKHVVSNFGDTSLRSSLSLMDPTWSLITWYRS